MPTLFVGGTGGQFIVSKRLEKCINDATCAYLTGLEITACQRTMSGQK